ncbi:hypothetical protein EVAR_103301_1 [Eumeta japonica]|uniref:Uncharacterized protein n=1 Tax=Eumeta variegata TaxID=151549 RepID=A0A4C1XTA1_EUMVA|nr:hypothetical protein EVAR_103301_1 [Eumeta japonica]
MSKRALRSTPVHDRNRALDRHQHQKREKENKTLDSGGVDEVRASRLRKLESTPDGRAALPHPYALPPPHRPLAARGPSTYTTRPQTVPK